MTRAPALRSVPCFVLCALAAIGGCACSGQSDREPRAADGARRQVAAPIDAAEIVVRESSPPQYAVRIGSGLPSGCATFERIDVVRTDSVIDL